MCKKDSKKFQWGPGWALSFVVLSMAGALTTIWCVIEISALAVQVHNAGGPGGYQKAAELFNSQYAHMLTTIGILVALFGLAVPMFVTYMQDKKWQKAEAQARSEQRKIQKASKKENQELRKELEAQAQELHESLDKKSKILREELDLFAVKYYEDQTTIARNIHGILNWQLFYEILLCYNKSITHMLAHCDNERFMALLAGVLKKTNKYCGEMCDYFRDTPNTRNNFKNQIDGAMNLTDIFSDTIIMIDESRPDNDTLAEKYPNIITFKQNILQIMKENNLTPSS